MFSSVSSVCAKLTCLEERVISQENEYVYVKT